MWPQLAEHCLSKGLPPRWQKALVKGLSWETRCPESSEGAVGTSEEGGPRLLGQGQARSCSSAGTWERCWGWGGGGMWTLGEGG